MRALQRRSKYHCPLVAMLLIPLNILRFILLRWIHINVNLQGDDLRFVALIRSNDFNPPFARVILKIGAEGGTSQRGFEGASEKIREPDEGCPGVANKLEPSGRGLRGMFSGRYIRPLKYRRVVDAGRGGAGGSRFQEACASDRARASHGLVKYREIH